MMLLRQLSCIGHTCRLINVTNTADLIDVPNSYLGM